MCGIVGYVGPAGATDFLVGGLRRLEYRGYDSSGVATAGPSGRLTVTKAAGRIHELEARLADVPLPGRIGIGHTRWAP
ncbi:MAG: glutamine--fructose-6-phosphate aminotransferase, partial [Planctomycetes bacterium]|nr:glutamine--fructose-6-phosphate aminotransferase [Planctomycetota bacterium]